MQMFAGPFTVNCVAYMYEIKNLKPIKGAEMDNYARLVRDT